METSRQGYGLHNWRYTVRRAPSGCEHTAASSVMVEPCHSIEVARRALAHAQVRDTGPNRYDCYFILDHMLNAVVK